MVSDVNKIKLPKDKRYRKWAVELAALIGFKQRNLLFPVVDDSEGFDIEAIKYEELCFDKLVDIVGGFQEEEGGEILPVLEKGIEDKRQIKGLESLFEVGLFLEDTDGDFLPEKINLKIVLSKEPSDIEVVAACNFAARLGLDCLGYEFPMVWDGLSKNKLLYIKESSDETFLEILDENILIQGSKIDELSTLICLEFPFVSKNRRIKDIIEDLDLGFSLNSVDGMKIYLENMSSGVATVSPAVGGYEDLKARYPKFQFKGVRDLKEAYKKEYNLRWEGDKALEIIESKVKPIINSREYEDRKLRLSYSLSEDEVARGRLSKEIEGILGESVKVDSVCSYKQGFSWIVEQIVPKLPYKFDFIRIGFKSFLPDGQSEWIDENGATPKITSSAVDTPDRWFDLPVRLLQELYPIDDILSIMTDIKRENVEFFVCEGEDDYKIEVFYKDDLLFSESYRGAYSERSYMGEFPGIGKVHPSTGYVRLFADKEMVFEELVSTDLEDIWKVYQDEILPYCKDVVLQKSKGAPLASMQPFFAQMKVEVWASEPDYSLPTREDLFSSLDALHEDIYFVGLDFFKTLGLRTTGENLDAPGLILPVIRKHDGAPRVLFTLFEEEGCTPFIRTEEELIESYSPKDVGTRIKKIVLDGEKIGIEIEANTEIDKLFGAMSKLLPTGELELSEEVELIKWISYKNIKANLPEPKLWEYSNIKDIDIMEDKIIGYDEYLEIINQLKRVRELRVFPIARSYQGRVTHGIELISTLEGYVSKVKSIDRCVSELVIGRHHANEVSSTNGIFRLIRELLLVEKYADVKNVLNLVFLPFENPDGAAIHYELQKENPYWKLHVARFNSLGKEIAYGYFDDDTIHTECMAFTKLWRRWVPDIITDNHGVPSHEWDQQFSGYTSPWFKGFWMPRALLYSYFFHIDDERFGINMPVNKAVEDVVADSMRKDKEIRFSNLEWQDRFKKYANSWMPKLFPAEYYKELISYFIPASYDKDHKYAAVRYPWITAVSFVSEVCDETAQGEHLRLCGRAHMTHDLAVIEMLSFCEMSITKRRQGNNLLRKRIRPIVCPEID